MVVVVLATLGAGTAEAQWYRQGDTRDRLRIQAGRMAESAEVDVPDTAARFDASTGVIVAWEFRWGGPYGLELAIQRSEHDFVDRSTSGSKETVGSAELRPVILSVNRHWPLRSGLDLYAGIGIADLPSSAIELDAAPGSGLDVTADPAPAFQVGLDWPLGERFAVGVGLRFVPWELELAAGTASWNALTAAVGVAIPIGPR